MFGKQVMTAPWGLRLTSADLARLIAGYQPTEMEDRWMCRADGPDEQGNTMVYVHRSWTGHKQFQFKVNALPQNESKAGDFHKGEITEITWERGASPNLVTKEAAKDLSMRIFRGVLGCELKGII